MAYAVAVAVNDAAGPDRDAGDDTTAGPGDGDDAEGPDPGGHHEEGEGG